MAEHSVRVSWICDPEDALWGLLHDAGEAYLNDIVRPAKTLLPDYQALEHRVLAKIARHYGLELPIPDSVHRADLVMCATEARDMLHGDAPAHWNLPYPPLTQPCDPWDWHLARARFLARYHELIDQER
ncbi:MAG: HD family hydrolase [bacterium]